MFINYYTVTQNQSDYIDVYLKNEVPKEINIAHDNMQYGYILVHVISYIIMYYIIIGDMEISSLLLKQEHT